MRSVSGSSRYRHATRPRSDGAAPPASRPVAAVSLRRRRASAHRRCRVPLLHQHECERPALSRPLVVPWNADGLTLSKGNRVRMMADGAHVMTPLNVDQTPGVPEDWQDVRLDAHVTDLRTSSARRINVGVGGTSRGFPVSQRYAVEPVIRPLAPGAKDQLKIIDVRPGSPTYLRIVRSVELKQMTRGPVAGVNPAFPTYERRFAAITPNGRYAFVSRGGDAEVDMVDTATGALTRVAVPTSLSGAATSTHSRSASGRSSCLVARERHARRGCVRHRAHPGACGAERSPSFIEATLRRGTSASARSVLPVAERRTCLGGKQRWRCVEVGPAAGWLYAALASWRVTVWPRRWSCATRRR
ncbi:MAG: hypothetical protein QOJ63_1655, partial [Solirubrobacteraceae bacterium]|nr:hypothetical protein [Solirubrobacteraceae bacterium]